MEQKDQVKVCEYHSFLGDEEEEEEEGRGGGGEKNEKTILSLPLHSYSTVLLTVEEMREREEYSNVIPPITQISRHSSNSWYFKKLFRESGTSCNKPCQQGDHTYIHGLCGELTWNEVCSCLYESGCSMESHNRVRNGVELV